MTLHKPNAQFLARLKKFRDRYAEIRETDGSRCGILRFLSDKTDLTQSHICRVAKGKANCVPYTLNVLEKAMEKWGK